jgi:hypothetical protein
MQPFDYALHYANFANNTPGVLVGMVMTTLQSPARSEPNQSMPVASFCRGTLRTIVGAPNVLPPVGGGAIEIFGAIEARFSDRYDLLGTPMAGSVDTIGVRIVVWTDGTRTLQINLTLQSWGNAQLSLTPVGIVDNILQCTGDSIGNVVPSATYLISLSEGAPGFGWQEPAFV